MSSVTEHRALRARNLRTVAALGALFLLPLVGSFWLYYGAGWRPAGHTNHGELITPIRPLPDVALPVAVGGTGSRQGLFRQRWTLVYVGSGRCEADCRQALYLMRQTRLALANNMERVQRVMLASSECCERSFLEREHSGLLVLDASGAEAQRLLAEFPTAERAHALFIVDPLGNLMMRYDARQNPRGLLEDLKKLLQLSHIG
jgi:hypothetical protein